MKQLRIAFIAGLLLVMLPQKALAAPFFYIQGNNFAVQNVTYALDIFLTTDSTTITAGQTIINFSSLFFNPKSISIVSSICSFWAPADPGLGFGNGPTPYFRTGNTIVLACGFTNPGYTSASQVGDLVARIFLTPKILGETTLTFDSANTFFRYIGSTVASGSTINFDLEVFDSTESAVPSPTPGPSSTALPTASPIDLADLDPDNVLLEGDLNFVELGTGVNDVSTTQNTAPLSGELVQEDNTVPDPPSDLERRPSATPFVFKLLPGAGGGGQGGQGGEVLAAQSLRELLIPGKSQADRTVVLFNLISTLTFLVLLAVVTWRLISITRLNRLKSKHVQEYLESELSTIESKMGAINSPESSDQLKQELSSTMEKISGELKESDSKNTKKSAQ